MNNPYPCEEHGSFTKITYRGLAYLTYCPICRIKELEHKTLMQEEEIGLLQAEVELKKDLDIV